MGIKASIKTVRAVPLLNNVATTTLRRLFAITGRQPEFLIKHLPRTGLTAVDLPNGRTLKLETLGEEWTATQLFWRGWQGYEPETVYLLHNLAQSARTVIDVGAHIGFYSLLSSLVNPRAQVFAFEPLAQVFASLERNVELNGVPNIKCVSAAVGAASGFQDFYFPDEDQPVSSSLRSEMLLATYPKDSIKRVSVPVVTLDEFVAEQGITDVDLIKLDTERTEHDVLAGARELMKRDRPEIICEVWPDAGNQQLLESALRPHGYRYYHLIAEGPVERPQIVGSEKFLNYLFTTRPSELGLLG